jgi:glycosyltransferase involved in cell wall biosynthesis
MPEQPPAPPGDQVIGQARAIWRGLGPVSRRTLQPAVSRMITTYVEALSARPGQAGTGPIRVVGYFDASSGIGASVRLAARAFEALGIEIERVRLREGGIDWDAQLARNTPAGPWIFHLNPPELIVGLAGLGPHKVKGPRYGYWAWELPRAPARWLRQARLLDEVWAPSRFTAQSLAGAAAPVRVVPHPLFLNDYAGVGPLRGSAAFQAVAVFDFNSSMARKNPDGVIAAFAQAFGDDPTARLTLKTQNGGLYPALLDALRAGAPANVEIIDAIWGPEEVLSLIAGADVLISLHRSEGFGLVMAEAMALGVAVLATGASGNLDFMDEDCAILIPSRPLAVEDRQGVYQGQTWADPDIAAASAGLRRLRGDPGLRLRLALAGRRRLAQALSPEAWFGALPPSLQAAAAGRMAR